MYWVKTTISWCSLPLTFRIDLGHSDVLKWTVSFCLWNPSSYSYLWHIGYHRIPTLGHATCKICVSLIMYVPWNVWNWTLFIDAWRNHKWKHYLCSWILVIVFFMWEFKPFKTSVLISIDEIIIICTKSKSYFYKCISLCYYTSIDNEIKRECN